MKKKKERKFLRQKIKNNLHLNCILTACTYDINSYSDKIYRMASYGSIFAIPCENVNRLTYNAPSLDQLTLFLS